MASLSPATRALWSLKAAKAPMTSVPAFTSHRFIHTSRVTFEETKGNDATTPASTEATGEANEAVATGEEAEVAAEAAVGQKLPYRRKRFHMWLQSEGSRFAKPSFSGPNFVGDVPFPMNPLFKPTPPLSDTAKEEIYHFHRSDTAKWTPRQLGMKYNISIKRVEAILRLKHLEKEMISEGFIPQTNFTKGMEQLMGVKAVRSEAISEPLTDILPQVGSPKFEAVDEDKQFTAVDAAKVLKRRPLAEIKARQLEEEQKKPFKLVDSVKGVAKHEPLPTTPISRNVAESSPRFKFAILDTSAKTTLIREKDGTLVQVVKA
ncbi:hypothetical protein BGZ80_002256 [Entomortierella chlamydospora]|uniref:Eukaryotic mitochondrial regulator protein-domain-containing protein n=1 Tax=Entomortierella chlamydospora TaxID=101097 RepID=A0A9P6MPX6_9FUNG|nr:hypothetical protein BGZ79_008856 [Entomortierella chlamydospora]KAG0009575.1 hypothetical protein BGZ80_002256 [Entomortierella chlamydospora]